jgi:fructose-bisphosphate aldolase, class II
MALVSLKEILDAAKEGGYAVPAFDALDHASAEAIIMAAEELNRPVVLMVPEAGLLLVDADIFMRFLVDRVKIAKVPIALELDHGKSFAVVMKAIQCGFTSVMIDGSDLPNDENIAITGKIVEVAHAAGVSVEAEIGHVAGGEGSFEGSVVDESMYTRAEDAKAFAEATGVDALAVAFGTVHGVYKGTPKLDIDRLKAIKDSVTIPLVMHGGSGVSEEDFVSAIQSGINKINLFTEISMAAVAKSVAHAQARENKLHFAELIYVAKIEVCTIAKKYIKLFSLTKETK